MERKKENGYSVELDIIKVKVVDSDRHRVLMNRLRNKSTLGIRRDYIK